MLHDFFSFLRYYFWTCDLGWLNILAFIISVVVHEYGHFLMAHHLGLQPKHPRILPFIGAYVSVTHTNNGIHIYKIALSGPLFGGLSGIICFYLYLLTGLSFLYPFALFGLCINVANLIPLPFLDGGKIIHALHIHFTHYIMGSGILIWGIIKLNYVAISIGTTWILSTLITLRREPAKEIYFTRSQQIKHSLIYVLCTLVLSIHCHFILK